MNGLPAHLIRLPAGPLSGDLLPKYLDLNIFVAIYSTFVFRRLPLSSPAKPPSRPILEYFVAVTAASIVATLQLIFSVKFKGSLVFFTEPGIGLALAFVFFAFLCSVIFGLLPTWTARTYARSFQWCWALPFVVLGALGSLSALPVFSYAEYGFDFSATIIVFPQIYYSLMQFAVPGAVGGFVYWLCLRRQLPLSPKVNSIVGT
jgi:hypothetical protein